MHSSNIKQDPGSGVAYTMPTGDGGDYTLIKNGDDAIGGMLDISPKVFNGSPECWFTFLPPSPPAANARCYCTVYR